MSLKDHFRPPYNIRRHWHAFHNSWATYISADLNRQLPTMYFAETNVGFGVQIHSATVTDVVDVNVYQSEGGPILAGAVELVSPANKDRPAHRDAFVSKCQYYLQQGVGLVIVDIVTERQANLHNALLERLQMASASRSSADLYTTGYRPVQRNGQISLDIWHEALAIGGALPVMPVWLRGGLCLRMDLEATYERTCEEQRFVVNGQ